MICSPGFRKPSNATFVFCVAFLLMNLTGPSVVPCPGWTQQSRAPDESDNRQASRRGWDSVGGEESFFATVEGRPIGKYEIQYLLRKMRPVSESQHRRIQHWLSDDGYPEIPIATREALVQQAIERQLIYSYLAEKGLLPNPELGEEAWSEHKSQQSHGDQKPIVDRERFLTQWTVDRGWDQYVQQRADQENLKKYFEVQQERFDGTQRRVAHLFVSKGDDPEATLAQVQHWREGIQSGAKTFRQLVVEHSEGSTAAEGGELGWIGFSGPMGKAFSEAAFATNVGELSPPILTSQGVHLILVLEKKEGTIPLEQRIDMVRVAFVKELWDAIVQKQRQKVSVRQFEQNVDGQ